MTFQVPITTPARKLAQADVTTDLQRREYLMRALSTSLSSSTNYIFAPFNTPPMKRHPPIKPLFLPTSTLGCPISEGYPSEYWVHFKVCVFHTEGSLRPGTSPELSLQMDKDCFSLGFKC